jgi:lysophospholipase L1-like esterase
MNTARLLLLSVLLLVLGSFVGGELWLRSSVHPPPDPADWPYLWPPLERHVYAVDEAVPGLAPGESLVTTNALGLRADELDLGDSRTRILTLGGSVTECLMLSDADAWPRRLQDALAARGHDVWVGNGGRSGQATVDYTLHVLELLPKLKPDLVIVLPGANDLQAAMEDRYFPVDLNDPAQRARMAAAAYPSDRIERIELLQTSYLSYELQRRAGAPRTEIGGFYRAMKQRRAEAQHQGVLPDADLLQEIYAANVAVLAEAAGDTPLLLMTHPHLWKPDLSPDEAAATWGGYTCLSCPKPAYYSAEVVAGTLGALNRETLAACKGGPAHCFDLDSVIARSLTNFYDGAHLTAAGAEQVATALADHLVASGLLK